MFIENYPDEIDMLSFFEGEAIVFDKDDQNYVYEFTGENGVSLIFSFSVSEGWIQIKLKLNGIEVSRSVSEGFKEFKIKHDKLGEYLYAEAVFSDLVTTVEIYLKPSIVVTWGSLIR